MRAQPIHEPANAKINLTLRVLGRRADGYHEIESMVAFATYGDRLALHPGNSAALSVTGPFAGDIVGKNLLETALQLLTRSAPSLRLGSITLEKNLPVAAGLGGGSADAAALLRAVRRANTGDAEAASALDWFALAQALGADVPVCLHGSPALMWGIGERILPLPNLPKASLVLANPRLPLTAGEVYRHSRSGAAQGPVRAPETPPMLRSVRDLAAFAASQSNDLEATAMALCPRIAEVKEALCAQPGALLARMSGSGPTCFALFDMQREAEAAAAAIARREPGWWVVATQIG